jgi:phosphoglycolate phosphatase
MKYELVIFDLDGTLLNTIKDLGTAVNHALALRGLPLHDMDEYKGMVGHGIKDLVTKALPQELRADSEYLDSALKDFRAYYTSHIDVYTRPYEGITELLVHLYKAGIRLAVASNKFQEGTEHLVKRFFPDVGFVEIAGNREGAPLKPDPAIVENAVRSAQCLKGKTILAGDSRTDILTAVNGGVDVVAVTWGFRPKEDLAAALSELSPDGKIADTVDQLRNVLTGE